MRSTIRAITHPRPAKGMTLLELSIGVALTTTIILSVLQIMLDSGSAMELGVYETALQAKALDIVDEIANDVKNTAAEDPTRYGVSGGTVWFYKNLGWWQAGEDPPGEDPLPSPTSGIRWSAKKTEYKFETVDEKNRIAKYEDSVLVKVLSDEVADDGFSMSNNGTSRVRIFVRLQKTFYDPKRGPQTVQATVGTDVKRQN